MLFVNDKKYELTEKDKKWLQDNFLDENGNLNIDWDRRQARVNPEIARSQVGKYITRDQMRETPPAFPIRCTAFVTTEDGKSNVWRYATSARPDRNGNPRYDPPMVMMRGSKVISDIEFAFYLAKFSPDVTNGEHGAFLSKSKKSHTTYIRIVVPEKEDNMVIENEMMVNQVRKIILEDAEEQELRDIAAYHKIHGSETKNINTIRKRLMDVVKPDPEAADLYHRYREFARLYNDLSKGEKAKAYVHKLVDNRYIKVDKQRDAWWVIGPRGEMDQAICRLIGKEKDNAVAALSKKAAQDRKIMRMIEELVQDLTSDLAAAKEARKSDPEPGLEPETTEEDGKDEKPSEGTENQNTQSGGQGKKPGRPKGSGSKKSSSSK